MFTSFFYLPVIKYISAAFLSLIFCVNIFFFDNDNFIRFATPEPSIERIYIEERDILMDIYSPGQNINPRSHLLVIHGATEFGKDDPRLVRICSLLARVGFRLYVPEVKELKGWWIGTSGIDDLAYIYKNYLTKDKTKRGMLSYSVGCAAMFMAASKKEIANDVDYLISFGGYYDTKHILLFMTTGFYKEKGLWRQYPEKKILSKVFLERNVNLVKEDERDIVLEIVRQGKKEELMARLSESSRSLVEMLFNRDKDKFFSLYNKIDPSAKELFESISPENYLDGIKANCYILHSVPDFVIPHTESELLVKNLGDRVKGYYTFRLFRHVEKTFKGINLKNIFLVYIPDAAKFYIFIYKILI